MLRVHHDRYVRVLVRTLQEVRNTIFVGAGELRDTTTSTAPIAPEYVLEKAKDRPEVELQVLMRAPTSG
jgi:hypothetical protein